MSEKERHPTVVTVAGSLVDIPALKRHIWAKQQQLRVARALLIEAEIEAGIKPRKRAYKERNRQLSWLPLEKEAKNGTQ